MFPLQCALLHPPIYKSGEIVAEFGHYFRGFRLGGIRNYLILPFSMRKKDTSSEKEILRFAHPTAPFLNFSVRNGLNTHHLE